VRTYFPSRENSRWFSQIQFRTLLIIVIEPNDQTTDTERSHSTRLSVFLLDPCDVSSDVFDGDWVFDGEAVRLTFGTGSVD